MIVSYIKRFTQVIFGLFLYSFGIALEVQASVGLAPWDSLNQGASLLTGIRIGTVSILISGLVLIFDFIMKEKIGFGTILNSILVGAFLDLILFWDFIPQMDAFLPGIAMQLSGLGVIGFASYFYISAGMGCGPRDGLMVALCKRFPHTPVGLVRGCLEGTVLVVGWLCGGTIGVGTVAAVFGLGIIIETVFRLFHFDVKSIVHENIIDTVKIWRGKP